MDGESINHALTYLYSLAALSVTFVGFSALVIILRQTLGGELSKLDVLIARIFIQLGFMVAAGCMLPPLLLLFHVSDAWAWRISSITIALPTLLFACTYPSRRKAASGLRMPFAVWIDVLAIVFLSLVLLGSGMGIVGVGEPGPFVAALTGILFVAGWAYLQALNTLLRHHRRSGVLDDKRVFEARAVTVDAAAIRSRIVACNHCAAERRATACIEQAGAGSFRHIADERAGSERQCSARFAFFDVQTAPILLRSIVRDRCPLNRGV